MVCKLNINEIKQMAKQSDKIESVNDLLALNKANDPFYIQENAKKKADWFRYVWENEGKPIIHPRGLHYQILGKNYEIEIQGENKKIKKIIYQNTEQCWNYLEKGAKYARLLGLVPYENIKDEQNPKPENVPQFYNHNEFEIKNVSITDDFIDFELPSLLYDNIDNLIEKRISDIVEDLFIDVNYYSDSEQPNYFEIWAEKKGVIPLEIAEEFKATIRPAGSGEFSLDMCYHAVKKAKESNKDLHIFLLSDFDPKGMDMPKSVARKVEFIARNLKINAFVHHVCLTKEQCIKYALPTVPAKQPKGDNIGYITHTEIFKKYAGQDPTEVNSFLAREPEEYRREIREAIEPYYDKELARRFETEKERLIKSIYERVLEKFNEIKEDLLKSREKLVGKLEEFNSKIQPIIKKEKENLGLNKLIENYSEFFNFDISELIKEEKFEIPKGKVHIPEDALLDTRRTYLEQIAKYKEFDIRENKNLNNRNEEIS